MYDPKTELTAAHKQRVIDFAKLVTSGSDAEARSRQLRMGMQSRPSESVTHQSCEVVANQSKVPALGGLRLPKAPNQKVRYAKRLLE
jgi:hypothetical protein